MPGAGARPPRSAAPEQGVQEAFVRPLDGRTSTCTPLGGWLPYPAAGGRQFIG